MNYGIIKMVGQAHLLLHPLNCRAQTVRQSEKHINVDYVIYKAF